MPKEELSIPTRDGTSAAGLFRPSDDTAIRAGAIIYMDIFGPRPSLDGMAQRLADAGYLVLLPDLFYRNAPYGPYDATAMTNPDAKADLFALKAKTTLAMTSADTGAFLDALTENGAGGPAGVVGYCMGGGRALSAAAAHPDRIGAAASFHGGGLASEDPDSPHLGAAAIKARVYVGSAEVDASFPPEQAGRLARALREARVDHMMENYPGVAHGWAVPDHRAFDVAGAERHWTRLLTHFEEALG